MSDLDWPRIIIGVVLLFAVMGAFLVVENLIFTWSMTNPRLQYYRNTTMSLCELHNNEAELINAHLSQYGNVSKLDCEQLTSI